MIPAPTPGAHQDRRVGRPGGKSKALRLIDELELTGELVDADATDAVRRLASKSRLRDAPGAGHLQTDAGDLAQLCDVVFSPDLRRELHALHLAEACIVVCVALAWFLRVPICVLGGMFDLARGGVIDRDVGGNGWAQFAGVLRNWDGPYSASNVRKRFAECGELWIPAHRKKQWSKEHPFKNFRGAAGAASFGKTYTQSHARKLIYFPAEVYRICVGLALCKRVYRELTQVKRRTPAHRLISGLRKAAGPKRRSLAHRGLDWWSSIAWSKAERQAAKKQRLPRSRVPKLAQSISKKDPPEVSVARPADEKGAAAGAAAGRGAAVLPQRPRGGTRAARRHPPPLPQKARSSTPDQRSGQSPRTRTARRGKGNSENRLTEAPRFDSGARSGSGPPSGAPRARKGRVGEFPIPAKVLVQRPEPAGEDLDFHVVAWRLRHLQRTTPTDAPVRRAVPFVPDVVPMFRPPAPRARELPRVTPEPVTPAVLELARQLGAESPEELETVRGWEAEERWRKR